jgi:hypothetical protein
MALSQFDVTGQQVNDEKTEEVIREGDPWRDLVRYQPGGQEFFVHARVNLALLKAAVSLPILLLKPQSRDDEVLKSDGLLKPQGSVRNYQLLEKICEDVTAASLAACTIAEQHGAGRRDFYFVTEDAPGFERITRAAAEAFAFPLAVESYRLAEVAPVILPAEAIGDLGIDVAKAARMRPTRFEFWGAEASLAKLKTELGRRGYRFVSLDSFQRELRVIKEVPIDGQGFRAVLREIAPLARSLDCSYRGTETVGGFDQFALTRALPERYAAEPKSQGGILGRFFGRKGSES